MLFIHSRPEIHGETKPIRGGLQGPVHCRDGPGFTISTDHKKYVFSPDKVW